MNTNQSSYKAGSGMNPKNLPNFKGKILVVEVAGKATTYILKDVHFDTQGGRLFLLGTFLRGASQNNWVEGVPVAIGWSRIDHYMIFNSVADYRKRQKKYMGGKQP
jgi:hypothetical protein